MTSYVIIRKPVDNRLHLVTGQSELATDFEKIPGFGTWIVSILFKDTKLLEDTEAVYDAAGIV